MSDVCLDSWLCPYCAARNYRANTGQDKCETCAAEVVTAQTGFEGDLQVTQSQPPLTLARP